VNSNRDWLDGELSRQLAPVRAPGSLWAAMSDRRRRNPAQAALVIWPLLSVLFLTASADLLWQAGRFGAGLRHLAQSAGPEHAMSGRRAGEQTAPVIWVKCSIPNDLPTQAGNIRRRGHWIAAVRYQRAAAPAMQLAARNDAWSGATARSRTELECASCHMDGHGQL